MTDKANINDVSSLERLYSRDDFERDAAQNARDKATVLRGLKVLSAPDGEGYFAVSRASQHVGERDPEGDSVFLAPQLSQSGAAQPGSAYDNSLEPEKSPSASGGGEYAAFLRGVMETAKSARFKSAIGRGEERLVGFHGG